MSHVLYEGQLKNLEVRKPVYHLIPLITETVPVNILLGGSSRFLYHNRPPSDFDLFMHSPSGSAFFTGFMNTWGLVPVGSKYGESYHTYNNNGEERISTKMRVGSHEFDLHYLFSEKEFRRLCIDHSKVEEVLDKNNGMVREIMRGMPNRGVEKYRAIMSGIMAQ